MPDMTAREILRKEYGDSRNFMTPRILGRGLLPAGAYELSKGGGFDHETIYGVSVVWLNPDGTTERPGQPISQMFHSREAARRHIRHLKKYGRKAEVFDGSIVL